MQVKDERPHANTELFLDFIYQRRFVAREEIEQLRQMKRFKQTKLLSIKYFTVFSSCRLRLYWDFRKFHLF